MATGPTTDELLAAILDAQHQCNNLLGELFNKLLASERERESQREAQTLQIDEWKAQNADLSRACKDSLKKFATIQKSYLERMLADLDEMSDEENEFEVREFLDKFGQGFVQLNAIISTVNNLSS